MKKYMTILFILAIASAFSLSVAFATDFETKDFDGKFKMDVIKGSDFTKSDIEGVTTYLDLDNAVSVIYLEDPTISPDMDESEYDAFKQTSGFEDDGTDGDIRIYKGDGLYGAMAIDDGIIVVASCKDRNDAIDMAKSIEFTK